MIKMNDISISADNQLIHGGDVYRNKVRLDFSVSLDPLDMPEEIKAAMLAGVSEAGRYPDPLQQKLREEIALLEGVSPEEVICGNGASELLMAAVHAVMPQKALITAPCYAGYAKALEASDAKIDEYMLSEADSFVLGEDFADRITDDTDMVFIADPNNPNGKAIDPLIKERIIRRCEEKGAVLVLDECFLPLCTAGIDAEEDAGKNSKDISQTGASNISEDFSQAGAHANRNERSRYGRDLQLRAFTKTFAIPGVRLGYMISRDREMLAKIKKQLPEWNVSRIAEMTGEAAARLLRGTDYLERSLSLIRQERTYLEESLRALGVKVYPSDVNYLLIKSRPGMYEELLERGILIRRCANFSGLDESYFRIAVRKHEDNAELVRQISEML